MRLVLTALLMAVISGCATPIGVTAADHRPGDTVGEDKFIAFLSVVRTTQTADADVLKLRRHHEDGTEYDFVSFEGRILDVGMDSLELFALELPAGTYSLDEMHDPSCYGCGYAILFSFPFGEHLGTFSGKPGEVVLLGTVFVTEQLRRILTSRPAEQNLQAQASLFRDAFPNIDFDNAVSGWDSHADAAYPPDIGNPTTGIRGTALGFHSPLMLANGDLAVGTNGGMVRVFRGLRDEVSLDTGMTSGPILAIAEPLPGTLVATSGAEMRQFNSATQSWTDVDHNLPDGFIKDLIRYEDGYIAVVRSMVTAYVAKGDFGQPWTVIASTDSHGQPTPRSAISLNSLTTTQEIIAHNAQRLGNRLFVHIGGKMIWEVDLDTGDSSTTEMPRAVRSFNLDDEGVLGCRCDGPALGFDHMYASPYLWDEIEGEWAKQKPQLQAAAILSDILMTDDGSTLYVVDRLHFDGETNGRTEIYSGSFDLEVDEPVFTLPGHHRYASRFQNGPGIYVTNYVDALAFSVDGGKTWRLLRTSYLIR